jgi:hypothetical protein
MKEVQLAGADFVFMGVDGCSALSIYIVVECHR